MRFLDEIKNNSILIIPNNIKNKIIKYLSNLNNLYQFKIITIDELKKYLLFDYNTETIKYIIDKNNINYENAVELIENMYFLIDEKYENKKIENLNMLKKELIKNNLLIKDKYFFDYIKNKNIYVFGFDYLTKFEKMLLNNLNININYINKYKKSYSHPIYEFNNQIEEIEFIANDIIQKNLNLNNVYIYGVNKDNQENFIRIFNNYNLPINYSNSTLYDTKIGQDFLNQKITLNDINNKDIKDLIIGILNKYSFTNYLSVLDMLKYEFKKIKLPIKTFKKMININNIFDNYFTENDYIYIIGFNEEYIPQKHQDTDFINDQEKFSFLETTYEKNIIEKNNWQTFLKSTKNLTITYANYNSTTKLNPSNLIKEFNYQIIQKEYTPSLFSNQSNLFNLGILLDNYNKNKDLNPYLPILIKTYPDHKYNKYQNKYQKIIYKDNFSYSLSYSKVNTFYECQFKYYCDYILKLNPYNETFDTWLGSLCHYILSRIYSDDFNFDEAAETFIQNNPFELKNDNPLFLNKVLKDLKDAINYLKVFQKLTKYQNIEVEKEITTVVNNVKFTGVIDKIMSFDDNVVLVDYKTGTPNIDLKYLDFGLNLQLPIYLLLIKEIYPKANIVGIYLEHILKPLINNENNIKEKELYEKSLRLIGYTLGNESYLKDFDPTFENSEFIKGLKLTSNGFSKYSNTLSKNDFEKLLTLTKAKILECIDNINKANFIINPKLLAFKNISCDNCPYYSICYKNEKDFEYLKFENLDKEKKHELDD